MGEDGKIVYKVVIDDKDAAAQGEKAGEKAGKGFGGKLSTAAKIGGAATAAAVSAASAAVVKLGKDAVTAYADYEQLVGGVETLFKDSADIVKAYAEDAYKTAGMTANQYMETVTSFSASLLQGLGGDTAKAAEISDMAISDMADNANKMGSSLESIQAAYQGFAKGQYQLLDNLKLGYGGTKTEMERLLADAEKFSGVKYDINNLADVYEAIHVIQTEMGITGTTAKEAASTISGSIAMTEAAWENLVAGLADPNADIGALVGNLVESASAALNNLLPVIEQALGGVAQLIENLAPAIVDALPGLISTVLPPLLSSALSLVFAVADAILANSGLILQTGIDLCVQLALGIAEALPELIPAAVEAIMTILGTLLENVDLLVEAALAIIVALSEGVLNSLPVLVEKTPEIILKFTWGLIKAAPLVLKAAAELILALIKGIVDLFGAIISTGTDAGGSFRDGLFKIINEAKTWGRDLIQNFINGIKQKWNALKDSVSNIAQTVANFIGFSEPEEGPLSNFHTYAPDMIDLFVKGIKDGQKDLEDALNGTLGAALSPVDINMTRREDIERGVSYSMTAGRLPDMMIIVPLTLDGREIARATAWSMGEQLAWEEV